MRFDRLIRLPLYVVFFAAYPSLTLYWWNIREADPDVLYRPLILSILLALILLGALRLWLRSSDRAALVTASLILVFVTYGHANSLLRRYEVLQAIGGPEIPLYLLGVALIGLAVWLGARAIRDFGALNQGLNLAGLFLVAYPLYFILAYQSPAAAAGAVNEPQATQAPQGAGASPQARPAQSPDIYYIILDGYSRQDTLETLGYDNRDFLDALREMGFYVATCSRSNYRGTLLSMTSALNMDYVWKAVPNSGVGDANVQPVYQALQHNRLRAELEARGYRIVSFGTGFEWNNWRDADVFLPAPETRLEAGSFFSTAIQPFEYLLLNTTALQPLMERRGLFAAERFRGHYQQVLFTLEQLPTLASQPGPKFVYAHIMVPHFPFIFLPDGALNLDTRYYGSQKGMPLDGALYAQGYLNNVQFINARLPAILQAIINDSATPPIIVVQGDHSFVIQERRFNILNAYYLPGGGDEALYPTITPINTFRVIFNYYFGTDLSLRKDKSLNADVGRPYRKEAVPPFPPDCP